MEGNKIMCAECGEIFAEDHMNYFGDEAFCEECYHKVTVVCNNCGTRIWRCDAEGDDVYTLCSDCYDNCYTTCSECNRLIHNEDACYEDDSDYPYCRDCFEKLDDYAIKSYSYKPTPIFYGVGNLFYGIELEVDKGGELGSNAQQLLDIGNEKEERIYCKHDGSLNEGFEIVSHPMTLDYHINNMNWPEIFEKAVALGYRSHNTSTAGYHIHCSRSAFGETYEQQEMAIGRVVYFVEKHWNELVRFSRRTLDNLNRWAARYATISSTTGETYKKAKDRCLGRYVAVNLENTFSVELRLFRGTLKRKTFIATLQLVDEICRCAINMSDYEMENMSWSDFVLKIPTEKAELIEYLKEKRLYVNEIITESEDM